MKGGIAEVVHFPEFDGSGPDKVQKIIPHRLLEVYWNSLVNRSPKTEGCLGNRLQVAAEFMLCTAVSNKDGVYTFNFDSPTDLEQMLKLVEQYPYTPVSEFAAHVTSHTGFANLFPGERNLVPQPHSLSWDPEKGEWRILMEARFAQRLDKQAHVSTKYERSASVVYANMQINQAYRENLLLGFRRLFVLFQVLQDKYSLFHRDLGPNNILVDKDGNITLIDFGLARFEWQEGQLSRLGKSLYERQISIHEYNAPPELINPEIEAKERIAYADRWGIFLSLLISISSRVLNEKAKYLGDLNNLLVLAKQNLMAIDSQNPANAEQNINNLLAIFAKALHQDMNLRHRDTSETEAAFMIVIELVKEIFDGSNSAINVQQGIALDAFSLPEHSDLVNWNEVVLLELEISHETHDTVILGNTGQL
ncbi:MAG: protein kinase domain-containing protein [Candidatus Dojkabacteria bacterium]